jgi:uncharacterized membrane protein
LKVIIAFISIVLISPGFAQKLVDPDKVAPEYREAAQKRRIEQINQMQCSQKANQDHVLLRDRAAFIVHCLDDIGAHDR